MAHGMKGPAFLFFAFTLAGTSVIAGRFVSGKLGVFTITAASLFFALAFLLPAYFQKIKQTVISLPRKGYLYLAVQALCGIFLFRMFLLSGLKITSSGEAGILTSATPAITAVLATVFLKERAGFKKIAGISMTMLGVLLIQGLLKTHSALSMSHFAGNTLVICAAACEALFNTFSRAFAIKGTASSMPKVEPPVQTAIVSFMALIFCLIPAIWEQPIQRLSTIGLTQWLALVWYGLFVTALAFICWYEGIRRCGALTAAAYSGMMPFTSALLSFVILHERLDNMQLAGGLLIAGGMILLGSSAIREKAAQSAAWKRIPPPEERIRPQGIE
jgi:drug/metabolite transporter (DMT)-like permease